MLVELRVILRFKERAKMGLNLVELVRQGKFSGTSLRALLLNSADGRMVSRLTQRMMKVIQADAISERGLRNVIDGEAELLTGFEFNIRGKLGTSLFAPFVGAIDRFSGEITVDLAAFVPSNMIAAPSGTTHFKIISAGAEVDFEQERFVVENSETAILPWNAVPTVAISQVNVVTPESTKPLFLAVGLEFYQQVNGQMYPLKNGAFNPLSLVQVCGL